LANRVVVSSANNAATATRPTNRSCSSSFSSDLIHASQLDLGENQFANFTFPAGLINLSDVDLGLCQFDQLNVASGPDELGSIFLGGNPLTTFVLSETLAASNLAATVTDLQNRGFRCSPTR
jgi:hypothetical protein